METDKVEIGTGEDAKARLETKWEGIRSVTAAVLDEFRRLGAKQVNLRLNESGKEDKRPVFIDWVALPKVWSDLAKKSETKDLGKSRLGEGTPSKVYEEALKKAGKGIIERNWKLKQLLKEKRVESKLAVQKAGLMYQRFIGIIAQGRCVGLLTVSFEKKPKKLHEVDNKMKQWASWPGYPKSKLVSYMEENFIFGGPFVK